MANTGDTFTIVLKRPHLEWGSYRYTNSRGVVYGEGYIPIPASDAYHIGLLNSNGTGGRDVLGQNIFNCRSADGFFFGELKAQGNQADAAFAKQFAGNDDLKAIGDWYYAIGANVGDRIRVRWVSPTDIIIEKI
ncbi:MAG: hypothetical protein IJY06_10015 [Oscillospiraceae bacterium]|nr:hypothetical protein [Oscillospiraceae bacterium]